MQAKDEYLIVVVKNGQLFGTFSDVSQAVDKLSTLVPAPAPEVKPAPDVKPAPTPAPAPVLADQVGTVGTPFKYVLPNFGIRIDVSDLPGGLGWFPEEQAIRGTPTNADKRTMKVNSAKGKLGSFELVIRAGVVTPTLPPVLPPKQEPVVITPAPDTNQGNSVKPTPDVASDASDQAFESNPEYSITQSAQ